MSRTYIAEPSQYPHIQNYQPTFTKERAEKEMLAILKHTNIVARRKAYGADYKKYLNVPEKSLEGKSLKYSF